MSIGFDIDGCMNNLHEAMCLVIKRDFHLDVPDEEYELVHFLNGQIKNEEFWSQYNKELIYHINIEKDAVNIMKSIRELKQEMFIITARFYNQANLTLKWLKEKDITYDEIFFNSESKLDVCKWKQVEIMIEDKPDTALLLAENGIKILLFDRPYNRNISHKNIIRCFNWKDVFKAILRHFIKNFSK